MPTEIKNYKVHYIAGGQNTTGYPYRARIVLYQSDGSAIGEATFQRNPATLPDTDTQDLSGFIWCRYQWQDFPQVLDILRNEKPVYLDFIPGLKMGVITTSSEPVGEGELT